MINYHRIFKKLEEIQKRLEEKAGCLDLSSSRLRQSVQSIASNLLPGLLSSQRSVNEINKSPLQRMASNGGLQRLAKHKKAVRFLYMNVLAVCCMWFPMPVIMFLIYFDGHRSDENFFLTVTNFLCCVAFTLLNTIVNPILYGFVTENFQKNYPMSEWLNKKVWKRVTVIDNNSENRNPNNSSVSQTPQQTPSSLNKS